MELTATDRPHGAIDTIPAAVARNARDTPDAPALVQGRRVMTWGDLGARSFAMAASLQRLGITPAGRVTMHFGSTLTLDDAAACVGILCACACHPVVADQPHAARLRLMERVAPAFVVASADSGPLDYPIPVLWHHGGFLESPADGVAAISVATRLPGRDDVAMITSTSGTTAEPKLVPILHRTLAAAGRTCSELADLHAGDRMLLLATPHFTLFCFSIVPFWMGGAVILPEGRAGDT
ncbi:MAG: AMP-binding protein [Chloroflexota bacterium]